MTGKVSFRFSEGRETSISLGEEFASALIEVAAIRKMSQAELIRELWGECDIKNFSMFVRGWLIEYYRRQAGFEGSLKSDGSKERKAKHQEREEKRVRGMDQGVL